MLVGRLRLRAERLVRLRGFVGTRESEGDLNGRRAYLSCACSETSFTG